MSGPSSSDLDRQIEQLKNCELIKEAEVKQLCQKAKEILVEEANVQRVFAPVTVSFLSIIDASHSRNITFANFLTFLTTARFFLQKNGFPFSRFAM